MARRPRNDAPERRAPAQAREHVALAGLVSASSSDPSISVKGVRNSWLTLLKKTVLARSS
jgi:hypothetical protein